MFVNEHSFSCQQLWFELFKSIQMNKTLLIVIIIISILIIGGVVALLIFRKYKSNSTSLTGGNSNTSINIDTSDIPKSFCQVATLSNYTIETIPIDKFVWLEKTDGLRTVIMFENDKLYNITNYNDIKLISTLPDCNFKRTILDTELYENEYMMFDAIFVDGQNISTKYYIERMQLATEFVNKCKNIFKNIKVCEYRTIPSWKYLLDFIKNSHSPYTHHIIDGVIVQRIDMAYFNSAYMYSVYKLKLPCMNTVDFYVKYDKNNKRYNLYLYGDEVILKSNMCQLNMSDTFNTNQERRIYIPFRSSLFDNEVSVLKLRNDWIKDDYPKLVLGQVNSLMKEMLANPESFNDKIIELSFAKDGWVPLRVRNDKLLSNSYYIGCSNMITLFDNIDPDRDCYFAAKDDIDTDKRVSDAAHDISRTIRQAVLEFVIGKYKTSVLDNSRPNKTQSFSEFVEYDFDEQSIISDTTSNDNNIDDYSLSTNNTDNIDEYIINEPINSYSASNIIIENKNKDKELLKNIRNDNKNNNAKFVRVNDLILSKPFEQISLLDLAGGRGGDLYTLVNMGITNIFAVDADKSALATYVRKRITILHTVKWQQMFYSTKRSIHDDVKLNCIPFTLCDNNQPLINLMCDRIEYPKNGFDFCLMNYAFHYLCYSHAVVKELSNFLSEVLNKSHGLFIVSYFDGETILSKMDQNNVAKLNDIFEITLTNDHTGFDNYDSDAKFALMPLPTIDTTGYRLEPLVTKQYLSDLNEHFELLSEFSPYNETKQYIETKINNYQLVKDLFELIRIRIYSIKQH